MNTIAPCSGTAFVVKAGQKLRVVDPYGEQVADLALFCEHDFRECLSNGRTLDYASTLRLTTGNMIYSNRSQPMAQITADTVGIHDFLLTPCSRDTWRICYGDPSDNRPGCFGNLAAALAPYGIDPDDIPTAFNCFMNVIVEADGRLTVASPRSVPGSEITFRAETDLIVGLTACSAAQSNNGAYKPIQWEIL